jgi:hypothetical protein
MTEKCYWQITKSDINDTTTDADKALTTNYDQTKFYIFF